MSRAFLGVLAACAFALLLANPARPAPAPKPSDKPEAPPTPAQFDTSANNLKQFGLAMHNYHDTHGHLPANYLTKDGKPGLSWRVAILPFMEADELYKKFKLDEPWDSDHNLKLVEKIPEQYAPVRGKADKGKTFYQMFSGKDTMLGENGKGLGLAAITDGLSNTFMVVEAEKPVTWTKPDDIPFDGKQAPNLGGMFGGEFHALFGDGSVRRIPKGVDAEAIIAVIGRADGIPLSLDDAIEKARAKE